MIAPQVSLTEHPVVSREEWLVARKALLQREKALTHLMDEVAAARRDLPWVRVDKSYTFEGPDGVESLSDLFGGRSQLMVYHFMFGPGWKEGCDGCSFIADHMDGANLHLAHHDVTLLAVSRAPLAEFEGFKKRMGWKFKWVSSAGCDFNFDYSASFTEESLASGRNLYNFEPVTELYGGELPGLSVFYKDEAGDIFHTYSTYARGGDILIGAHNFLDMTPKGRNESSTMNWVRHHDRYESAEPVAKCCGGCE